MKPIVRQSILSTLVIQPSFRALGEMQVKWETFEKPENKRQMYGNQSTQAWLPFVSYFVVFQMSAISPAFGPELWNLAVSLMSTCSFE